MCGRYSLTADMASLEFRFAFDSKGLDYRSRYNVAPTQEILTVTNDDQKHHAQYMRWGLVPSWAKDVSIGERLINARVETVATRPAFRSALRKRRCLILADGFYEWKKTSGGKRPMRIVLKTGEPFAFAGLWETWRSPDGQTVLSCTIITTTPNAVMEPIHSRMPVILARGAEKLWLDPQIDDAVVLAPLLVPYIVEEMEAYPVSTLVNSPTVDRPEVAARAT